MENTNQRGSYAFVKHVCAESYAKETQFDDDRDKLEFEEDSPDYERDNTLNLCKRTLYLELLLNSFPFA